MHEVPGVLLLLRGGLRRKVRGDGVEERPGLVAQLHPVRGTLVRLHRLHLGLGLLCGPSLHEVLEVAAGSAGPAIHLLRHGGEGQAALVRPEREYDEINSATLPRY